ncbi:DUF2935 domain-containing protein [Melghirimyces algeriensis]|uniref:DUF2935 domain-containing protein n=1 Tax=Melghirimyces algeriensis TaxID=910412 RepID=A0A521DRV9_9BACL|nr:DUF2935 domain-containing protein [Melghirimyces algeriensis]SMO74348.1 protein of unknown function [Melghirimyces algeriensis]
MLYAYGSQMPLRILDEIQFWKEQEKEHTVVIRELSDELEPEYVASLKKWEQDFAQFETRVVRYIETAIRYGGNFSPVFYQQVLQLTQAAVNQSQAFLRLLAEMEKKSRVIAGNPTLIVVIRHIERESEYFIGVVQGILYPSHSRS